MSPQFTFRGKKQWLAPIVFFAVFLLLWEGLIRFFDIPKVVLPSPLAISKALFSMKSELLSGLARTLSASLSGLAASTIIGLITAGLFSQSRLIRLTLYPYAILLQTIPIVAIAPIVLVSLGRGFFSISLIACLISLFPIITNTTTGLMQVDRELLDLFKLCRATRWQIFTRLQIPTSMPYLISGIRIASGASIVGAIVGEFFVGSSQPGLGAIIQQKDTFTLPDLYAAVFVSALLGSSMFAVVSLVGELVLRRWFGMSLTQQAPGRKGSD